MIDDLFGQPTTLATPQGLSDWNAVQLGFLAHSAATPGHLAAVLKAEPDFALGHAARGLFYLLLGRRELYTTAREALAAARAAMQAQPVTPREARYVAALAHWLDGAPLRTIAECEAVLDETPTDPLAMKLSQAIRFLLGDAAGMRASVERLLPAYAHDHPARGYLLGCRAFALEETGDYLRAEIAGRQALWMAPNDAWGLHAVAHVHDMTGRARQGIDWLAARESAWAHCNNFRYHVWWHKALMHLETGETEQVLALYDDRIRKDRTDDYRDISNATSLLMRLELEGIPVGDRWEELADLCARRTGDGCLIFADLHYLLALNGAGREADKAALLARISRDAEQPADPFAKAMAAPGRDAAVGLVAFSEGRNGEAFHHLARADAAMQKAGGSHAQRDVFKRLTIDAALRAGYLDHAERFLNERKNLRAGSEDGFAACRRALISGARGPANARSVPAE